MYIYVSALILTVRNKILFYIEEQDYKLKSIKWGKKQSVVDV